MSLSTQLRRGTLALPMLMLFGLLGFVEAPKAQPALVAGAVQAELLQAACPTDGGKGRVLVLAQAPADLGNLVIRLHANCRA
jgi:hypothetical protein